MGVGSSWRPEDAASIGCGSEGSIRGSIRRTRRTSVAGRVSHPVCLTCTASVLSHSTVGRQSRRWDWSSGPWDLRCKLPLCRHVARSSHRRREVLALSAGPDRDGRTRGRRAVRCPARARSRRGDVWVAQKWQPLLRIGLGGAWAAGVAMRCARARTRLARLLGAVPPPRRPTATTAATPRRPPAGAAARRCPRSPKDRRRHPPQGP